jgi:XTP/dITP diphosphohydrolase
MKLLIATNNDGKIKELHELLADLPIELKSLREFENVGDVAETGETFEDNAILKAREYALQTNLWSVADDSGLEVDALGGAPGVFSARYAGEGAGNAEKIEKLLREIDRTQDKNRSARFVCVMAIADEKGAIKFVARGFCEGKIAEKQAGNGGFGYDPVFIPAGFENTFGELSSEIKRQISHRARASAKIIRYLRDFIVV